MKKTDLIVQISYYCSTLKYGGYELMQKMKKAELEKIYFTEKTKVNP